MRLQMSHIFKPCVPQRFAQPSQFGGLLVAHCVPMHGSFLGQFVIDWDVTSDVISIVLSWVHFIIVLFCAYQLHTNVLVITIVVSFFKRGVWFLCCHFLCFFSCWHQDDKARFGCYVKFPGFGSTSSTSTFKKYILIAAVRLKQGHHHYEVRPLNDHDHHCGDDLVFKAISI